MKTKLSEELIKDINNLNWYRHGIYRGNILIYSHCLEYLGKEWFRKEGLQKWMRHIISLNDEVYIVQGEFDEISKYIYEKICNKFLKDYLYDYERDNQKMLKLAKSIGKNHKRSSLADLKKDIAIFFNASRELQHWLWSMEFLNDALDKYLREKIKIWKPAWKDDNVQEFLIGISFIDKKIAFQKERIESLHINNKDINEIKKLHSKYEWLSMNMWDGRPFSLKEYGKRINNFLKDKEQLEKEIEENRRQIKNAKRIIDDIDDKELKGLIKTTQQLIFLKTYRIDVYTLSWYYILPLIDEICKRIDVPYANLIKMTSEEVIERLNSKNIKTNFNYRDKYAVIRLYDKVYLSYGKDCDIIKNSIIKDDFSKIMKVTGVPAQKGKVRGIARVLMTDRELNKVKKGDILICNLTNPNYNPVFGKIKAIVTDEGGILCHSAIMAREYKIPCVISTKIATLVFKDNDYIEVDADKGIVRKIKWHR